MMILIFPSRGKENLPALYIFVSLSKNIAPILCNISISFCRPPTALRKLHISVVILTAIRYNIIKYETYQSLGKAYPIRRRTL